MAEGKDRANDAMGRRRVRPMTITNVRKTNTIRIPLSAAQKTLIVGAVATAGQGLTAWSRAVSGAVR